MSSRPEQRRRLLLLGAVVAVAAVAVVVAVLVSSGGGTKKKTPTTTGSAPAGAAEVAARFQGIPQSNLTLGKASAPATMEEFADLKCPICQEVTVSLFPKLVDGYVRTGKVKVIFRPQTFVGQPAGNSEPAARFALAAGLQNKLWQFVDLFYVNQGDESTAYVNDAFLRRIGAGVQGLDVDKALADSRSPTVDAELAQADALFKRYGFSGTPSFTLGRTGGALKPLTLSALDFSQFSGPIEQLLKK
jgi:protein-disulfide isomerase